MSDKILDGAEQQFKRVHPLKKAMRTKAFPLLILLAAMVAFFSIFAPLYNGPHAQFFNMTVFWRILQDLTVPGFLTLGVALVLISGGIDISQVGVAAMSSVVLAAGTSMWGWPWWFCIILAIVMAAAVGLINGLLINKVGLMPFIATMGMNLMLGSVGMILSTNERGNIVAQIQYHSPELLAIGTHRFGEVPTLGIFMALMFVIYGIVLTKSKFGRTLYLMGGNRAAANLAGINARKVSYILFINCSVFASFAGMTFSMRTRAGGHGFLAAEQFTGITAAIMGGISFGGGAGGLGGAFIGLMILRTFGMGMLISGLNPFLAHVMRGALLLAALTFDYFNLRMQAKRVGA
ncbi:MAG: ABC transporter permease [Oscillospiraceae bacterium]|nr:ABC transporter permease [Oscillospiraceae bacterium]